MLNRSRLAPWIKDIDHWIAQKKEHPEGVYVLNGHDENGDLITEALFSLNSKRKEDFMIEAITFIYNPKVDGEEVQSKAKKSGCLGVKRHPGHKLAEDYFSSRHVQD